MGITTEQSNRMIIEAVNGNSKTSIPGEEAQAYYKLLKAEVDEMLAKGIMVMPHNDD